MSSKTAGELVELKRKLDDVSIQTSKMSHFCNNLEGNKKTECFILRDDINSKLEQARKNADSVYYDVTDSRVRVGRSADTLRALWRKGWNGE